VRDVPAPTGDIASLAKKARYRGRFGAVYVGQSHLHLVAPSLNALLAAEQRCPVTLELAQYLPLKQEQRDALATRCAELATAAGWASAGESDSASFARFLSKGSS
jgi:hypothetical protein